LREEADGGEPSGTVEPIIRPPFFLSLVYIIKIRSLEIFKYKGVPFSGSLIQADQLCILLPLPRNRRIPD